MLPFRKRNLLVGLGLLLGAPGTLLAQESRASLEEIVVTAERRTSTVQDTAAAITALSGDQINRMGVTDANDLGKITPSLHVTPAGNQTQIYLRGVGNYAANTFAEGAVALSLDGIYISRTGTYWGLMYDVERVEVLKGPQGTLYGRNATGGAINLISARPQLDNEVSGHVRGEFGNYDAINLTGAINVPVSDQFAVRAALQRLDRDGYFDDGGDDADSLSGRLSALYEPAGDLSLLVVADFQNVNSQGVGGTITGLTPFSSPSYLGSDGWDVGVTSPEANAILANFGRAPLGNPSPYYDLDAWGLMAELNWDFGPATLTAIPAYRETDSDTINYAPGFLIDVTEKSDQTSLELRLASNDNQFVDWIAGLYYFDETTTSSNLYLQQVVFFGPGKNSTSLTPSLDTTAYAAFGQLIFNLAEDLRLITGARYTQEDKGMTGSNTTNAPPPGSPPVTFQLNGDETWEEITWKVGLEYDATADSLLYANISTGFKAGGFFSEQDQFGNSFDPETLTAYAIGSKNRFADGRAQLNAEIFYWDYEDHQESQLALSPGGYSIFVTENIGQAEIKGLDLEGSLLVGDNGQLDFQLQYLDAEFKEFAFPGFSPGGAPLTACPATPQGGPFYQINCDGFEAIRAPEWSGSVHYRHTLNLQQGAMLAFDLWSSYAEDTYTTIDYAEAAVAEATTRTDAAVTWYSPGDQFSVSAWVRNIENEETISGGFISPFTPLVYSQLKPPRTYGLAVNFNF